MAEENVTKPQISKEALPISKNLFSNLAKILEEMTNLSIGDVAQKDKVSSITPIENERKEIFLELIRSNIDTAKNSSKFASQLFEEVKKQKKLKVIEAVVPKGILPPNYSVALYDVRIATHGPDESVYQKNQWIRQHVTRGMTFMEITGQEKLFDFALYANRKFTGGIGDEDECQPTSNDSWREFCLQATEDATKVLCMEKLNGEAGHFAVRSIGGNYYIIAGSKNVHLLCKDYSDIDLYTEPRYFVARTVAKGVLNAFANMNEMQSHCLKQLLSDTKITAVCELLQPDHQHIVNLSYLNEAKINLLMFCSVANQKADSLTAIPPHLALDLADFLGLPTPRRFAVSVQQIPKLVIEIRGMTNLEGYVLYYLKGHQTIGLAKVKTVWYVVLRALREKVDHGFNSRKSNAPLQDKIAATLERLKQLQYWLKFDDDYLDLWKDLAKAFFVWMNQALKQGKIFSKNIRPKFPLIWAQFLAESKCTDTCNFKTT